MLNFNNKILKLIKLSIKLINKLIFTINKIENAYRDSEKKVENLSTSKTDLSKMIEGLEKLQEKLGEKKK